MIIPAAMNIESAIDTLKSVDPRWLADQQKELHAAVGEKSDDFKAGYQLGVQAARVMVAQSSKLIMANISPGDVL